MDKISIKNQEPIKPLDISDEMKPFLTDRVLNLLDKNKCICNTFREVRRQKEDKSYERLFLPVQFMGLVVNHIEGETKNPEDDAKEYLADMLNRLVERNLIDYGFLAPIMKMDLVIIKPDVKRVMYFCFPCCSIKAYDEAKKQDMSVKDYINNQMDVNISNLEGALPDINF